MNSKTIALSILVIFFSGILCEEIKVTIKLGSIHGFKQKIYENQVNTFLGIPFAQPPIGDLRFRKPQPITEKWSGILDATKWPKICMQDTLSFKYYNDISEDCLYLNVWTPVNLDEDFSQNLRPVMVFIHGGAFALMGSSYEHYNGSVISSFGDVVVVTMNYRLGAFGFLSTGTSDAPGNVGLYDQALALEWVQENIAYFGGDANRVTLFGESAGAMSVSLHLYSPLSQHINRAIIMSGSIYQTHFLDSKEDGIRKTLELVKLLGCTFEEGVNRVTDNHMECLRKAEADKIVELQWSPQISLLSKSLGKVAFVPIFGESFVPKEPTEMLKQASIDNDVELLVGTVANEGLVMLFFLEPLGFTSKFDDFQECLKFFITHSFKDLSVAKVDEILTFYFKDIVNTSSDEAKMAYYTALGDIYFNCETVYFSEVISQTNDLYQYLYDYAPVNEKDTLGPCDLPKVCHGNELPVTFGTVSDPRDLEVSKKWMKIVTDFAKSGNPGWQKHGQGLTPCFEFTGNKSSDRLLHDFRSDACKLWKRVFEIYY